MSSEFASYLSESINKAKAAAKLCNFMLLCGKMDEVKDLVKEYEGENDFRSNLDKGVLNILSGQIDYSDWNQVRTLYKATLNESSNECSGSNEYSDDEKIVDEKAVDEKVADEEVVDEKAVDEEVVDEKVVDEKAVSVKFNEASLVAFEAEFQNALQNTLQDSPNKVIPGRFIPEGIPYVLLGDVVQALVDIATGYTVTTHNFVEKARYYNVERKYENNETCLNCYEGKEVGKPSMVVKIFGSMIMTKFYAWGLLRDVNSYDHYPLGKNRVIVATSKDEVIYQATEDDCCYYSKHEAKNLLKALPPNIRAKVDVILERTQAKTNGRSWSCWLSR